MTGTSHGHPKEDQEDQVEENTLKFFLEYIEFKECLFYLSRDVMGVMDRWVLKFRKSSVPRW